MLCAVPDAKDLDGFGTIHAVGNDIAEESRNYKLARTAFKPGLAHLRKAPQALNCIVDGSANAVGRGKIAVQLDVRGNFLQIFDG